MKRSALFFRAVLVPVDALSILLAAMVSYRIRVEPQILGGILNFPVQQIISSNAFLGLIASFIPVFTLIFALEGLYNVKNPRRGFDQFAGIALGVSTGIALVIGWLFFTRQTLYSRLIVGYFWIGAIIFVAAGRALTQVLQQFLHRWGVGVERVAVVGCGLMAQEVVGAVLKKHASGLRFVGLIREKGEDSCPGLKGVTILGTTNELDVLLERHKIDQVIVADPQMQGDTIEEMLLKTEDAHASLRAIPSSFAVRSSNVETSSFDQIPMITFLQTPLEGWGKIYKRGFDIVASLFLIGLLSPVLLLIAIGIKLTSPGPILHVQQRMAGKKVFPFLKFRSMYQGAEEKHAELMRKHGVMFKLKEDPRVTPFGRFLRRTSLDELPQLFNVLGGDMSLVGPRPPLREEVEHYNRHQRRRLLIKPGMTGLWQVSGRSDVSFDEWVQLDLYYMEHWSVWLDLQIILKTIWIVLVGRGAY